MLKSVYLRKDQKEMFKIILIGALIIAFTAWMFWLESGSGTYQNHQGSCLNDEIYGDDSNTAGDVDEGESP